MILISLPLAGLVSALNYPDSIYSATAYLSKVLPENPLIFPLMNEMAVTNIDGTLDYHSLFYQAEDEYDAINTYARIIYDSVPETLTAEQKVFLKTSLEFIRNNESTDKELQDYCQYVYRLMVSKFGGYLELEPIEDQESNSTTAAIAEPSPHTLDEVVFEKRHPENVVKEEFDDTLNGSYSDAVVSSDFVKEYIAAHNTTLRALLQLSKYEGASIFNAYEIVPAHQYNNTVTSTLTSEGSKETEIIYEKRRLNSESESLQQLSSIVESYQELFVKGQSKLQFVTGRLIHAAKAAQLDSAAAATISAIASVSIIARNFTLTSYSEEAKKLLIEQSSIDPSDFRKWNSSDKKMEAISKLFEIDFIASELGNRKSAISIENAGYDKVFLDLLDSYSFDPKKNVVDRIKEFVRSNEIDYEAELELKKIEEIGYSDYLLRKLNDLFTSSDPDKWDKIDQTVISINKFSLLVRDVDRIGVNGINIHNQKLDWLNRFKTNHLTDERIQLILNRVENIKTVVDHISDEISFLVDLVGDVLNVDPSNANDPAEFFEQNSSILQLGNCKFLLRLICANGEDSIQHESDEPHQI
jgi:hypothetical protein